MILDNASQSYNGKWNDAPNSYYPVYGYVAEHSTSVPEPGILMSLLIGLVSLAGVSRLRRK
jgi:hypothetical protein